MTNQRFSRSRMYISVAVVATLIFVPLGCSSNKKSEDSVKSDKRAERALAACKGVDTKDPEKITDTCADAQFIAAIADSNSDELYQMEDAKLITIGRGTCAYAAQLVADPTQATDYESMVEFNAKNWKLSEKGTRKIMSLAEKLCPKDMAEMLELTKDQGPVELTFDVSATGPVQVSYTGTSKDVMDQSIKSPWKEQVKLDRPAEVTLTVFPSDPKAASECTIKLDGEVLDSVKAASGELAVCRVDRGRLAAAAAGVDVPAGHEETTTTTEAKAGD